jgi:hypothetical protein
VSSLSLWCRVWQPIIRMILCQPLWTTTSCLLTAVVGIAAGLQGRPEVWRRLLQLCEAANTQPADDAA